MKYEPKAGDMVLFGKDGDYKVVTNLNKASDINYLFYARPVKFPEGVTFALCTTASNTFHSSPIESFPKSATFENLVTANSMFYSAGKVKSLSPAMLFKNLANGDSMFAGCSALESLPPHATFEKMSRGRYAFSYCTKLHSLPEDLDLRSLGANSENMFVSTSLDEASVLRILDDERGIQEKSGGSFPIHIGIRTLWKESEAVAAKLGTTTPIAAGTYSYKGWTVTVQA